MLLCHRQIDFNFLKTHKNMIENIAILNDYIGQELPLTLNKIAIRKRSIVHFVLAVVYLALMFTHEK